MRAIQTRHFFPESRFEILQRSQLHDHVSKQSALLMIHGGPGTGKTLAALEIASAIADSGVETVWLRLSGDEWQRRTFWERVFEALTDAALFSPQSTVARMTREGLSSPKPELIAAAISERKQPMVLVLDDLHLAGSDEVLNDIVYVLEQVPALRVIATSRVRFHALTGVDSRLRLTIDEISETELALSASEVEELLARYSPSGADVQPQLSSAAIHRRTKGWPLAVHALIVEHVEKLRGNRAGTRHSFVHSYVDRIVQFVSAADRPTLWVTALLREVSPEILTDTLGLEISDAIRFLDELSVASLSYWEDGAGTRWYRHHDMVREELLSRAFSEVPLSMLRLYYARAAEALLDMRPRDAIEAAIRGEAWELLTEILVSHPSYSYAPGGRRTITGHWLRDIPGSVRNKHPVLAAFALIDEYAVPAGRFQRVFQGFRLLAGPGLQRISERQGLEGAVASVLRMAAARLSGQESQSIQLADQARNALLSLAPHEIQQVRRTLTTGYAQLAITYLYANKFSQVEQVVQATQLDGVPKTSWNRAHVLAIDAFSAAWQGRLAEARRRIERAEEADTPFGWEDSYAGAGYRIASALECLESGDLDTAQAHLDAMHEMESTIEHWPYIVELKALITESRFGAGEALARLEQELQERRRRFQVLTTPRRSLAALHARLVWQSGRSVLSRTERGYTKDLAGVYAALGRDEQVRARAILGGFLTDRDLVAFPRRRAEALLLHAHVCLGERDLESTSRSALLAASILQEYGLTLPYRALPKLAIERLQEFAPELDPTKGADSVSQGTQTLSLGEVRALAAVAEHGTATAAANTLFLSPHTVRHQLKLAYRKLGVRTKADAIRKAREIGVLDAVEESSRAGEV